MQQNQMELQVVAANGGSPVSKSAVPCYKDQLGDQWRQLQPEVQLRFSDRGRVACYTGTMKVSCSTLGLWFARLCMPFGRPLATRRGEAVPVCVNVSPNPRGGLIWARYYDFFANGNGECVRSTKRLSWRHGLEEHISGILCMALSMEVIAGGLLFRSQRYSIALGRWRLPLPAWLTPGQTVVTHEPLDSERFRFTLSVRHRLFGELYHQDGVFIAASDAIDDSCHGMK